MSISLEEVRHIAVLARLGIDDAQAEAVTRELSSILSHMQVLAEVEVGSNSTTTAADQSMPLRPDAGPPIPLARTPHDFAPEFRDGFFLVPRLASHEDVGPGS